MEIYKTTYGDMDWDKLKELKKQLDALDINCQNWTTDQTSMIEVGVTSEDALIVLLDLKIINKYFYDELIGQVQTLFLS